jgi:hypothetical protein
MQERQGPRSDESWSVAARMTIKDQWHIRYSGQATVVRSYANRSNKIGN